MSNTFPKIDLKQTHAAAFLDACLQDRSTQIPALSFTGPEGSGKEMTAIDFARKVCCTRDEVCALDQEDLCESCAAALALEHPGIHISYPTPTQGSGEKEEDDESDIGKVLDQKRQDLFASLEFTKKVSLRVARSRAIIRRANTKPFGSTHNVFIIVDAHTMREEAQNALLKLVEEPPAQCVIVLLTPNPDAILYTIRSRCQRLRFSPLGDDVIASILTDYYGVPPKTAAKAAELSRGNIQRAKDIVDETGDDERDIVYGLIEDMRKAPPSWAINQALKVARKGNRDAIARFLHEFATAYRDVMAVEPDLFINKDHAKVLGAQAKQWPAASVPRIVDRIIETRDGVLRRNLNIEAALVDLFLEIRREASA